MATLTIRNLRDDVYAALRVRAAQNGRSLEAEARQVIETTYKPADPAPDTLAATRARIQDAVSEFWQANGGKPDYSVDQFLAERREEAMRENEKDRERGH